MSTGLIRIQDDRRARRDLAGTTVVTRGVRSREASISHVRAAEATLLSSRRLAVVCDLSAALAWGLPLPAGFGLDPDSQAVAVCTGSDGSRHRGAGVRGRRLDLPAEHITRVDGLLVTSPARTWLDCAPLMAPGAVLAMGDALLAMGLADRREIDAMVSWGRGRRGVVLARSLAPWLDPRVESPGESWLRWTFLERGFPRCSVNSELVLPSGRSVRLDACWERERVAAEYDGREHHGHDRRAHDRRRRDEIRAAGWTLVVFRAEDLGDPGLLGTLRDALAGAGARFGTGIPCPVDSARAVRQRSRRL